MCGKSVQKMQTIQRSEIIIDLYHRQGSLENLGLGLDFEECV